MKVQAKAVTLALAVLAHPALAQMTNTLAGNFVYPTNSANTGAPGFVWNVYQVAASSPGNLSWAETELAGVQGPNLADPTEVFTSASGNGTVLGANAPVSFIIPAVINFSIAGPNDCSHNRTDLPCEDGMVGIPGTGGGTVNFAAEALTYLLLQEGPVTMGVRSDDGFSLQIGAANPADRYSTNAVFVTELNGTRGAADTTVTFNVPKTGLYAARLLYFQQGGDSSVEWFSIPPAGSTNGFLGALNDGTNAVLVGDVADGGIPAYRSITAAPLGSYVSSLSPTPGTTGLPVVPVSVSATIVNGAVAVSNITLSVDGALVTPVITTSATGVSVVYTSSTPLANTLSHLAVLNWYDDGKPMSVSSTFATVGYFAFDPSTAVTPDTSKPGFRFNIWMNGQDPFVSSKNGVQGGESDNLDNIELGLNGLVPDGNGGYLPNMATPASANAAAGPAPALGGPAAPAEFIITNVVDLDDNSCPGMPASDGPDPSHSEVLTYVNLPVGLTTFTLTLDGFYRAFGGSWDYTKCAQLGSLNNVANGDTSFYVYAGQAGCYPIRITYMNLDPANLQLSIYTLNASGGKVLLNDVAHGGLEAYYAQANPNKPYVRYTSPRPVPRQVEYPNARVLLRIQDLDTKVTDSTASFVLNGATVPVTKNRVGDVLEMTWTPTTLQTPAEIQTGTLTFQETGSTTVSNQWKFMNLKAVWLPTAKAGYWLPISTAAIETFAEYPNPTDFETNDPPTTGKWITSPQPSNPLVDVCPVWTNVPAGPDGWFVWNWDAAGDGNPFSPSDPNGPAYANWLVVDLTTFSGIESDSLNTAPGEMINGVPLVQLVADPSQNIFIAESDNRSNSSPGQNQFAMSQSFDLSNVTNPVIAWASIQKQNQDNINSFEYSIDGGQTWAPIIYYLDGHSFGSDPADVQVNFDNTVDVNDTLFHDLNPGEIPVWTDASGNVNNTYASCLGAPISSALAPFFAPRVNDDKFDAKRIEVVRLPLAAHQSNVRLRLGQIGTCSWYFGLSQIAFFDVPPSGAYVPTGLPSVTAPSVLKVTSSGTTLTITWTGKGTLESATALTSPNWTPVTPAPTSNTYTTSSHSGSMFFRVVSNN